MANRIAFVTWDGGGNVGPAIGIAQALAARGHQVCFHGYFGQRRRIETAGFGFVALERSGHFDVHRVPPEERIAALLASVWTASDHLSDLPAALARHPADVMVVDFMMQGALAARLSVPMVALVHSAVAGLVPPAEAPIGARWLAAANGMRTAAGLPPLRRLEEAWGQLLTLVTTIPELDRAASDRGPRVRYVGPIVEQGPELAWEPPWSADDRRPLVVVSFSTTGFWDQRGRIRNALDALESEPVRVLVLEREAQTVHPVPRNAAVRSFVAHASVLPQAALTITHCGHGTVTASLAHGVPILGMPHHAADQPYLAKLIQERGAGIALDGDAPAESIRSAVRAILAEPSYAAAARTLGAAIKASVGAAGAVQAIERVTTP
jgi:MGT family glycosyltransferase